MLGMHFGMRRDDTHGWKVIEENWGFNGQISQTGFMTIRLHVFSEIVLLP